MEENYLIDIKKLFDYYKTLGEGAMKQVSDEKYQSFSIRSFEPATGALRCSCGADHFYSKDG